MTQLANQLASDIQRYIAANNLPVGTRLPERGLAEHFRVSRSPVREALKRLAAQSVIESHSDGGFVVADAAAASPAAELPSAANDDAESTYLRIAEDRLAGALPDRITESELIRRYGPTRNQLTSILRRMVHEGWIERLPGHGWAFLPTLSSSAAYNQSYRFRLLLEPAALLESSYRLDEAALRACKQEQEALVAGGVRTASPAQLFDANTHLHETIAGFSGNLFIVDSLRRLNRVRRLMEYRKAVDRDQAERRCREHLTLIDLLLTGQREAAADFMRLHLRDAAREKASATG
ncbi:GntR family transcriptional regulator (plasmid) [Variovorax sp. V213]|uniref:GntR family transcriptional regulator n=1 Tax=Variovorax sp. V213 TaxID=3065955 RepID=UPI0034E8F2AB